MIRLLPTTFEDVSSLTYRNLVRRSGELPRVERLVVPVQRVRATGLPAGLEGIVALSDLQGAAGTNSAPVLPTHTALDLLERLGEIGELPPLGRMVVCLGGDHFARLALDKRGGSGDVTCVWRDAGARASAVVGVVGNHDRFEHVRADPPVFPILGRFPRIASSATLLDGAAVKVHDVRIAGVSGTIGDPARPFRRTEEEFLRTLRLALSETPDLLLLHQGPAPPMPDRSVSVALREACAEWPGLTIYGHDRVPDRFEEHASGAQFLNVLERVVVMVP